MFKEPKKKREKNILNTNKKFKQHRLLNNYKRNTISSKTGWDAKPKKKQQIEGKFHNFLPI